MDVDYSFFSLSLTPSHFINLPLAEMSIIIPVRSHRPPPRPLFCLQRIQHRRRDMNDTLGRAERGEKKEKDMILLLLALRPWQTCALSLYLLRKTGIQELVWGAKNA